MKGIRANGCVDGTQFHNLFERTFNPDSYSVCYEVDSSYFHASDDWRFSLPEPLLTLGELIVNPSSCVHPSSSSVHIFQISFCMRPLVQSKSNFLWSIPKKEERKFV